MLQYLHNVRSPNRLQSPCLACTSIVYLIMTKACNLHKLHHLMKENNDSQSGSGNAPKTNLSEDEILHYSRKHPRLIETGSISFEKQKVPKRPSSQIQSGGKRLKKDEKDIKKHVKHKFSFF